MQSGFIADVTAYMGTDKMRFLVPVYPYDTIRVEAEVLSKKETRTMKLLLMVKTPACSSQGEIASSNL